MCNKQDYKTNGQDYRKPQKKLEQKISTCPVISKEQYDNLSNPNSYPTKRDCPPTLLYKIKDFLLWQLYNLNQWKNKQELAKAMEVSETALYNLLSKPMEASVSKTNWQHIQQWVHMTYPIEE